jgi:putative membrane protein
MKHLILYSLSILFFSTYSSTQAQTNADFVSKAGQGNMAEIAAGKIAVQKAANDSVKQFAQMMIDDHTTALNELNMIAKQKNKTMPSMPDDTHKMAQQKLAQLKGMSFDSTYMMQQLQDHQQTIALFEEEAKNGTEPELKAYAEKYLPKIRMHYEMAQRLSSMKMQGTQQQQ